MQEVKEKNYTLFWRKAWLASNDMKNHHKNEPMRCLTTKLLLCLALGVLLFTFGCKQNKNITQNNEQQQMQESPQNNMATEIVITITGDAGCTIAKPNTIKLQKNYKTTWKDIKESAQSLITLAKDKELKEWRLGDAKGTILKDTDKFEKDVTIYAVTKEKENPIHPTNHIVLTIKADSGYTLKEPVTPCIMKVEKGTRWLSIKEKVNAKIELKKDYEATGWKLRDKNGSKVEDDNVFNEEQTIYATSKKKESQPPKNEEQPPKDENQPPNNNSQTEKITITVAGDAGINITSENTFKIDKKTKWQAIKNQAISKINIKDDFEIKAWYIKNSSGQEITENTEFEADETVFATTKRKIANYKVEYWQENASNDEFAKVDEESKTGEAGLNTQAQAKIYKGFLASEISQKVINADGTTVVKLKYKRKRVSLIVDLKNGTTDTELENGGDGKKLLKGKFGQVVSINNPTKNDFRFKGWQPPLPILFPENDDVTVYTAKWAEPEYKLNIKGDERIKIVGEAYVNVPTKPAKTFQDVKSQLEQKLGFQDGWSSEEYAIYDWHLDGEDGETMLDSSPITQDMTVYVRTNYKKFHLNGTTLKGYDGAKPRGRIFIPKATKIIARDAFKDCEGLISVDFSACSELEKIEDSTEIAAHKYEGAFFNCPNLKSVNFSGCVKLKDMGRHAFCQCKKLEAIDLSFCVNLQKIGIGAFDECHALKTVDISNCNELVSIGECAFFQCYGIESVDLSACTKLKIIGTMAFFDCTALKSLNLNKCNQLASIGRHFASRTGLEVLDLSACLKITELKEATFGAFQRKVKLPQSITKIEKRAFTNFEGAVNKLERMPDQVLVPNEAIKQLVIKSGYPAENIELY